MRNSNARVEDLRAALTCQNGIWNNGNHCTQVSPGVRTPDVSMCHECPRMLYCINLGTTQPDTPDRPCTQIGLIFKFSYHGTVCLTYTTRPRQVTDHGYWGYSVTTSRAIRWYLEALMHHRYLDSQETVNQLCKTFKKRHSTPNNGWIAL